MEETKILLGSRRHKLGVNEDNFISVGFESDSKVIPYTDDSYRIDAYSRYLKEKDESDKFRLAFTVTPFCSNVLFNMVTEPVYKEGSNDCIAVYYSDDEDTASASSMSNPFADYNLRPLNTQNVIRDTGYSHKMVNDENVPLVYHCGYDIFNNHTLRKNEFNVVNVNNETGFVGDSENFNTIKDKLRDRNGNGVEEEILQINMDGQVNTDPKQLHLYQYETIDSFDTSIYNNLIENNGWFGFLNVTTIPINNFTGASGEKYSINKCMNNNKAWEQIDMYPDRSLYSFVPKLNKYRGRVERNWDYCITYPFSSDTSHNIVTDEYGVNGIKCKIVTDITDEFLRDEERLVVFKTFLRHNFTPGGYVTLSFVKGAQNERKTANPVKIISIGKEGHEQDYYFSVRFSSILNELERSTQNGVVESVENNFSDIRVRKYENGGENKYYLRIFKKLGENYISSLNKLAFSQNIYSDQVAQIVFTEDVMTNGVTDNLGRPLSEIYLTIVKRNKGYEEWYRGNVRDENIEFSHCFGEITSGLDMPDDIECSDYNVHRIHSIPRRFASEVGITESPEKIEEGITIDNDTFYGDVVEFSPSNMKETVIESVYHRFNTAQREDTNGKYNKFTYDEIRRDDYDIGENFSVETNSINNVNLVPEGYYYKPHYKVQIRKFEDEVQQGNHIIVNYTVTGRNSSLIEWSLRLSRNYYFETGDTVYAYDVKSAENISRFVGVCESVTGKNYTEVTIRFANSVDLSAKTCRLYRKNPAMPNGAYELPDGTGRYLWREIQSYSNMGTDDELYDEPFTNGAHYFHRNVMFYLKRQDPYGDYGIGYEPSSLPPWFQFSVEGKDKDVSYAEYIKEGRGTVC